MGADGSKRVAAAVLVTLKTQLRKDLVSWVVGWEKKFFLQISKTSSNFLPEISNFDWPDFFNLTFSRRSFENEEFSSSKKTLDFQDL